MTWGAKVEVVKKMRNSSFAVCCSAIFATDCCNTRRTVQFSKKTIYIFQLVKVLLARPVPLMADPQVIQRN